MKALRSLSTLRFGAAFLSFLFNSECAASSFSITGYSTILSKRQALNGSCEPLEPHPISAPKSNIWNGLADEEILAVTDWLLNQHSLNLTSSEQAGDWDNSIILVEQMLPNKTHALEYLDNKGQAPQRYAHVVLNVAATTEPYYQDLIVGPLPIRNGTTGYQNLTWPYTRKTDGRIQNISGDNQVQAWVYNVTSSVSDITRELWNATLLGFKNDTLRVTVQDPLWQDDGIINWYQFWGQTSDRFDDGTLLPLGLYFSGNLTGRDPSLWTFKGWLYNNAFYRTTEDFRAAFFSPGFEKLEPNVGGTWSATDQNGQAPPLDELPPPVQIAPGGSRYYVNKTENYVKWMDFEFYTSFTRYLGLHLFDIRFKGDRIIYELGLEEALAHYAGNDPYQSGTAFLDTKYEMGANSMPLVPGYDCPTYATFLSTPFNPNSICLFEATADYPIQRHTAASYVSVTKNTYFTIRHISTMGNYDYLFSYSFYMDGGIHVDVRASGYIAAAYWAHNDQYGYRIHDALSGSMHDHVLNFKVDIDILGTANTLTNTTFIPTTEEYPWSERPRNTMKLARSNITSEDQGKLFWGDNGATQWAVVNADETIFGNPRGYKLIPSNAVHLTVKDSSNLANAVNWAAHDFYVTKQKDTEPRATHPRNAQDVHDPVVDFAKFFDGESLAQEDLVLWVNLGMHHVPHTGDLPNTVFTTAQSGLQIVPLNYLPGDPSRETVNMVRIDCGGGNNRPSHIETFDQGRPTCLGNVSGILTDLEPYCLGFAAQRRSGPQTL